MRKRIFRYRGKEFIIGSQIPRNAGNKRKVPSRIYSGIGMMIVEYPDPNKQIGELEIKRCSASNVHRSISEDMKRISDEDIQKAFDKYYYPDRSHARIM